MANTDLPQPELPVVMLVTPDRVTLEVLGGPTQVSMGIVMHNN